MLTHMYTHCRLKVVVPSGYRRRKDGSATNVFETDRSENEVANKSPYGRDWQCGGTR